MKSRALLLVCVLLLVTALVAVFAVGASAADVTELNDYALVLNDGVDIKVTGTVAEADLESEIQVITTCHGETAYDVTVEDGAFEVQIPVSATHMAESIRVDLVVDGDIVDTQTVSVNAYAAAILADEETPVATKQLVSDMLRYGQAVLTYAGADDEAAALVEGLELLAVVEPDFDPFPYAEAGEAGTVAITEIAMELDARINFLLTTDVAVDDYIVEADGYETVVDGTTVKIVGISIADAFKGITVGIYDAEDALVSNEICYSPMGYIMKLMMAEQAKETPDTDAIMVCRTLALYGASAHAATDHEMEVVSYSPATCAAEGVKVTACAGCGATDEEILPVDAAVHAELTYAVVDGKITYTCADCEASWTSTSLMLADGTSTSMLEGNASTNVGFVGGGAGFPNIVDGHYEFVKAPTPATSQGQFRLVKTTAGATANGAFVENRLGFVSVSLQAVDVAVAHPVSGASWTLQLANNAAGGEWAPIKGKAKGYAILNGVPGDGSKAVTCGGVEIALAADGFTRVDISFVPVENDMHLLTYYVDGVAVDTVVVDNMLNNYTPNCLYFSCNASYNDAQDAVQQSVKFDDLSLAFTDGTKDEFFPKNHVHAAGTEVEKIDDKTHGVKCQGCDVFVAKAAHDYDFSSATCGGEATGTCACGATTTKTIECTLVATSYVDNVVTYECKNCDKAYTLNATKGSDCSAKPNFSTADIDATSGAADGVYNFVASQTAPNSNAIICAYPGVNSTTMLIGFDIKNTATRAGYFQVQFRTPPNNWTFNPDATLRLEVKPDGSIYFGQNHEDTGLDVSTTEFTSILMKATFTEADGSTTLTTELWVNGQYVGASSLTKAGTGFNWSDSAQAGAQICLQNKVGANAVVIDNIFGAATEATGTDITAYLTAK